MWKPWQKTKLPEVLQKQFAPKRDITLPELAHIVSQLNHTINFDQETWDKQTKNIKRHFRDI